MRILYIGSAGSLSLQAFHALCRNGYRPVAVAVDNPMIFHGKLIALQGQSLALAARDAGVPVLDMRQPLKSLLATLRRMQIDTLLMACYPRRLPAALWQLPQNGSFNCHPSMLPAYRGPEPVFWQLRDGVQPGVSWHRVVEAFDAGDVIWQRSVAFQGGETWAEINQRLAALAAEGLLQCLPDIETGALKGIAQPGDAGHYCPYPQADDFWVDTDWPAKRAYDFIRASAVFGHPWRVHGAAEADGAGEVWLSGAHGWAGSLEQAEAMRPPGAVLIPFKQSVLIARRAGKMAAH